MWIVFRLLIAFLAFVARFVGPFFIGKAAGTFDGHLWYKKLEKTKKGEITSFRIGMPLKVPVLFRLQRESGSDQWFKKVGLAHEFQTGDATFDDAVYIACDHPAVHRLLKEQQGAREQIEAALDQGFRRITGDGRMLWIERYAGEEPGNDDLQMLASLRHAFAQMRPALTFAPDPYSLRVVAVEALTWSIFAYAAGALMEYFWDRVDVHLEPVSLVAPGLVIAAVLFVALVGLVWWLLRGSSRGSRILIEGVALLAVSIPIAGIQLLSDVNRGLDRADPTVSRWIVKDTFAKRSRRSSTYYIVLGPAKGRTTADPVDVPGQITVDYRTYSAAKKGGTIEVQVSPGALGYRWYRRIQPL